MTVKDRVIRVIKSIKSTDLSDEVLLKTNYLEKGLFDSFQMVELITKLESEFNIKFPLEIVSSERFRTPKGIIEIIQEQIQ